MSAGVAVDADPPQAVTTTIKSVTKMSEPGSFMRRYQSDSWDLIKVNQ